MKRSVLVLVVALAAISVLLYAFMSKSNGSESPELVVRKDTTLQPDSKAVITEDSNRPVPVLDTTLFNQFNTHIVNGDSSGRWPVKTAYPLPGAVFPFKRVIAFYGNLYSKQVGILGELPWAQMLAKLKGEVANWQ